MHPKDRAFTTVGDFIRSIPIHPKPTQDHHIVMFRGAGTTLGTREAGAKSAKIQCKGHQTGCFQGSDRAYTWPVRVRLEQLMWFCFC